MPGKEFQIPSSIPELLEALQKEDGISPAERVKALLGKKEELKGRLVNDEGEFRVLGTDRFDGSDWLAGSFKTAEEAIEFARKRTDQAKSSATDSSIATVYYAYDPEGKYLGGDTWERE